MAVARAGVWTRGPTWAGRRTGLIGLYAAVHDDAGRAVLNAACTHLSSGGADLAVGPLNGSTWFSYRLVTDVGDAPPFALDLHTPPADVSVWASAGFSPLLTYHSAVATPGTLPPDPRAADLRARFADVTVRPPGPDLNADLRAIHALSLAAFAGNPFYAPIPFGAFEALYAPLLARAPLDWVWLAERHGELVGFMFNVPDPAWPGTLVVKTVAARPGRANAGLGRFLANELHARAFRAGFARVVHALMWDGNDSAALSARRGRVIRRYALFARELASE